MEASKLKEILDQHRLWNQTDGVQGERADLTRADLRGANLNRADLSGADLRGANLTGANLTRANLEGANLKNADLNCANLEGASLTGADLTGADLTGAKLYGANLKYANIKDAILPDVSWIIPGCLVQLNLIKYDFYLEKERKRENFVQDSFGVFIQDNMEEKTFDMLVEDQIIRNIPHWVKYTGLSKIKD